MECFDIFVVSESDSDVFNCLENAFYKIQATEKCLEPMKPHQFL